MQQEKFVGEVSAVTTNMSQYKEIGIKKLMKDNSN